MSNIRELEVTLDAYKALIQNRHLIESGHCTYIGTVPFDFTNGACAFVGEYTHKHLGLDINSNTFFIENMNLAMGLDDLYPVVNEDYQADGNLWRTTNPTHNAVGRWEYVAKCVQYIQNEIDNYEK